jgi:hypothetical protein
VDSAVLVFRSGSDSRADGDARNSALPEVLFCGANLVIATGGYEKLRDVGLSGVRFHPAAYVDDYDVRREGYWFVDFIETLDCWDRRTSWFEQEVYPVMAGGETLFQVYEYCLDAGVLDGIPLERRLLFKMGGTLKGMVVSHNSLLPIFSAACGADMDIVAIADY